MFGAIAQQRRVADVCMAIASGRHSSNRHDDVSTSLAIVAATSNECAEVNYVSLVAAIVAICMLM
jgi:hypothetical protein